MLGVLYNHLIILVRLVNSSRKTSVILISHAQRSHTCNNFIKMHCYTRRILNRLYSPIFSTVSSIAFYAFFISEVIPYLFLIWFREISPWQARLSHAHQFQLSYLLLPFQITMVCDRSFWTLKSLVVQKIQTPVKENKAQIIPCNVRVSSST